MSWATDYNVTLVEFEIVTAPASCRVTLARGGRRLKLAGPFVATSSPTPPTSAADFDVETICHAVKNAGDQDTARLAKFLQPAAYAALP